MAKEFFVHNRDFYKSFFGMTIVIALQNAIVFAVNLADAIMLRVIPKLPFPESHY